MRQHLERTGEVALVDPGEYHGSNVQMTFHLFLLWPKRLRRRPLPCPTSIAPRAARRAPHAAGPVAKKDAADCYSQ